MLSVAGVSGDTASLRAIMKQLTTAATVAWEKLCSRPGLLTVRMDGLSPYSLRRAAAKAAEPTLTCGAHKEIKFSNDGRASILKGVDVLANAVQVTLGPKGTKRISNCEASR